MTETTRTDLDLSKDIGKVAERVGKLEGGFNGLADTLERHMEDEREQGEKLDKRLEAIEEHSRMVCTAARVLIFCVTKLLPAGAAIAAILLALDHFGKI